eukprot:scaffold603_cov404-Prasinococcus_capsulatus_cf.AAC.15
MTRLLPSTARCGSILRGDSPAADTGADGQVWSSVCWSCAIAGDDLKRVHSCGNIALVEGDLFALDGTTDTKLSSSQLADLKAAAEGSAAVEAALAMAQGQGSVATTIWDRGSLVAIEPNVREKYAHTLAHLLHADKGKMLVVTVYHTAPSAVGPPYSISFQEIKDLYEPYGLKVEMVHMLTTTDIPPKFRKEGLTDMDEVVYVVSAASK